jgi:DNA (cytosine-5)-methyltransferase 1
MSKKKYSYVSLFSSSGVGCYGFKLNGFECVATNELIERRIQVQKNNQKCSSEERYVSGDILDKNTTDRILGLVEEYKKQSSKEIDFLVATPPCQGISVANHKKTKSDKKRNSLVVESIKLTKAIKPNIFIYENVRGFLRTICSDEDGFDKLISEAIEINLGDEYLISSRVVNFKYYGVPSSRTRTLVIGVRKDLHNLNPNFLFPYKRKELSLRESIGHLPSLETQSDFWENDFLHNYKSFDPKMLPWIENLKEGQSAFDNTEEFRIPHTIKDGIRITNANKNSDKYKKQKWDQVGPCVHTRNDTFSSQNTIHPTDNRVFSIRELMVMMSIPETFNWFDKPLNEIISLSKKEKADLLKKNEINIRQSIGESVPTKVFYDIAKRYIELNSILKEINYESAEIDSYLSDMNLLLSNIKSEIVNIKLVHPDILTLLIIYNAASLFDRKRIYIEIVSPTNLVKILDIPNHFTVKNGITKGHIKVIWTMRRMVENSGYFHNNELFDKCIIFTNTQLNNYEINGIPVKKIENFKSLNLYCYEVILAGQISLF